MYSSYLEISLPYKITYSKGILPEKIQALRRRFRVSPSQFPSLFVRRDWKRLTKKRLRGGQERSPTIKVYRLSLKQHAIKVYYLEISLFLEKKTSSEDMLYVNIDFLIKPVDIAKNILTKMVYKRLHLKVPRK